MNSDDLAKDPYVAPAKPVVVGSAVSAADASFELTQFDGFLNYNSAV